MKIRSLLTATVLLLSGSLHAGKKATTQDCTRQVVAAMELSMRAFKEYPDKHSFNLFPPEMKTNAYDERILIYSTISIGSLDGSSFIPEASAEVIVNAETCQILRTKMDIFSGYEL
jgi:hypothetical protein